MRRILLGILIAGCARQAPEPAVPYTPAVTTHPAPVSDEELLCYYGDTHFHSGYSGDNRRDGPPLEAWKSALARTPEAASHLGGWLGGYFLFVTDHVTYTKTRPDMDDALFQKLRAQSDDPSIDRSGPDFTFTAFAGAEMTGLRRGGDYPYFDDKFGHLNFCLMDSIAPYVETDMANNQSGETVMDRFAANPQHLGQFNHPGYGEEPRTGDDSQHLYPYTPERDRVFRFIEVNDDVPKHWEKGVSQYNLCLRRGYHVSPVVGTDIHNTKAGLTGQARTVFLAPSTLGKSLQERRSILIAAARAGRVYATENQTLQLQWSLDGQLMGSRLERRDEGEIQVTAQCANGLITRLEVAADRKPDVSEDKIDNESQCTRVLARWKPGQCQFQGSRKVKLRGVHYLYVRLWIATGERAVTAPIYLESASTGSKP
ncbi:MAG: CehA/McbA family metallohydrolase [Candidatus Eremiobacteraeota bacterium]|nr:CehA/McbA family metallohydrolase [Candidatus Eremiobacteraeota bacterium]